MAERAKEDASGVDHWSSDDSLDEALFLDFEALRAILRSAETSSRLLIAPDILENAPGPFDSTIASSSTIVLIPVIAG